MEFLVLGPIEVRSGDSLIHVGGVKQRSILALLIANHGHSLSADQIVEEIYGEDAAPGARRSVQTIISMLRRDLGDVIVGTGNGYRFDAPRADVDAYRFEDRVAAGLELVGSDARQASSIFDEALGLWRSDPYGDVDGRSVFEPEVARLNQLRFAALEARAEADLACGRHREALAELEALVAEYPLREHLWRWLMLALYRTGRQADALAAYQRVRALLGEELGLEPSAELRELEEQVLLQDPALDLVPAAPHNLPVSLTSFVGRRLELLELGELLAAQRLVTLTGAGGSGKTRLAVELARQLFDDYPDGVWFVDLRSVDAGGVAPLIAALLGVVESGDTPIANQLVDALAGRRLLLVLDNCEHVLDAVAPLAEGLTSRDGHVRVLATSREPLGIPGESMMPVHPLPLPESVEPELIAASDAVALFTERAGSAQPGFTLDQHIDAVFEICRAVEGLPLALELAAARLVVLSPEELADRLDDQLATLRSSQRAGDLRHATLETTISWSWRLLSDAERTLLGRLSVFNATWSLDAAEAICGFEPISRDQIVDLMVSLVTKSLVVVDGVSRGATRYRLLEPIRQYATRQLDGQATIQVQNRCVGYWSTEMGGLRDTEVRFAWRDLERARALESDHANLSAAIEWALAEGRYEDAMSIFASPFAGLLWLRGSDFETLSRWMNTALDNREAVSLAVLLSALEVASHIAGDFQKHQERLTYATLGIEYSRASVDRQWFELSAAVATNMLEGHSEPTRAWFDRIITQADEPRLRASALIAKAHLGRREEVWPLMEAALQLSPVDSLGFYEENTVAIRIVDTATDAGHYDIATETAERMLASRREFGALIDESLVATMLAWLYAAEGRLDEAAALITETLPIARRILGPNFVVSLVPYRGADIARQRGDLDTARGYVDEARQAAERNDIGQRGLVSVVYADWESALIARDAGDLERAEAFLRDAVLGLGRVNHADLGPGIRASLRIVQASVELRRGAADRALEALGSVLAESDRLVHLEAVEAVDLTAIAVALRGRAKQAARLKGAIDHERDATRLVVQPPDVPLRARAMRHAQTVLGDEWDKTVVQGSAMTLAEAIELAAIEAKAGQEARDISQDPEDEAVSSA